MELNDLITDQWLRRLPSVRCLSKWLQDADIMHGCFVHSFLQQSSNSIVNRFRSELFGGHRFAVYVSS